MRLSGRFFLVFAVLLFSAGLIQAGEADEVSAILAKAERQIMEADSREKAIELIETYEAVLDIDPENYEALWSLGRYYNLLGAWYTEDKDERIGYYNKALDFCKRGMMTNPGFKALVEEGEKVEDAARVLTKREMACLFYWFTGEGAIWYEYPFLKKLLTVKPSANRKILDRMMEIDPEWAGGHPYFAYAVFYTLLPRFLGGNMKKAEEYYAKAEAAGPNWLFIKFGRAQYFHTKKKDREAFIEDMEWVLTQDPKTADSPYPANVHFQREAKRMLENIDEYFK